MSKEVSVKEIFDSVSFYPCKVTFEKYFVSGGTLEGLTITEKMGFMDWDDACDWAGKVTKSSKVPYVILEMTNLETGEKEYF
jgi:hypothetical protein